jgi:hypothetical protein
VATAKVASSVQHAAKDVGSQRDETDDWFGSEWAHRSETNRTSQHYPTTVCLRAPLRGRPSREDEDGMYRVCGYFKCDKRWPAHTQTHTRTLTKKRDRQKLAAETPLALFPIGTPSLIRKWPGKESHRPFPLQFWADFFASCAKAIYHRSICILNPRRFWSNELRP